LLPFQTGTGEQTAGGGGRHFSLKDRHAFACACTVTAAAARAIHAAPASMADIPMATFTHEGGVGGKVNIDIHE